MQLQHERSVLSTNVVNMKHDIVLLLNHTEVMTTQLESRIVAPVAAANSSANSDLATPGLTSQKETQHRTWPTWSLKQTLGTKRSHHQHMFAGLEIQ